MYSNNIIQSLSCHVPFLHVVQYNQLHFCDQHRRGSLLFGFVFLEFWLLNIWRNVAGEWVSHYGRCLYDLANGDGIFDVMFVSSDGLWLYADDAKSACAER